MSSPVSRSHECRVPTAVRLPRRERVGSALRVAGRPEGLDRAPLEALPEMERVAGRRRAIGQDRGQDAGEPGCDPGRVPLRERDLDRFLAAVVPTHERRSISVRDEREQAVRSASAAVRRSSTLRRARRDQEQRNSPGATEEARGTVWPDGASARQGPRRCQRDRTVRASSTRPSRVRRQSRP